MPPIATISQIGIFAGLAVYALGLVVSTVSIPLRREGIHHLGQKLGWVGAFIVIGFGLIVLKSEGRL